MTNFQFKTRSYSGSGEPCVECGTLLSNGQKFVEISETESDQIPYRAGKYHVQCLAKRKYFIAFLDILGFKRFAETHSLYELYEKIQDMFIAARSTRVKITSRIDNITREIILADVPFLAIFDSIIIYQEVIPYSETDDQEEWKEQAFNKFIIALEAVLKESFRRGIFLRGGISYGEAIIRLDPQSYEHIILGKPYIEAVEIEKTQSWMGVAFHPSLSSFLEGTQHRSELVEYEIPKKKTKLKIPNITIGWVDSSLEPDRDIFDEWETEEKRHKKIKKNTRKFFNQCLKRSPRPTKIEIDGVSSLASSITSAITFPNRIFGVMVNLSRKELDWYNLAQIKDGLEGIGISKSLDQIEEGIEVLERDPDRMGDFEIERRMRNGILEVRVIKRND